MVNFDNDIENCIKTLNSGGLILYPTDTIWGIGCDATNSDAVDKIYRLKEREDSKSMIILVADQKEIKQYAEVADPKIFDYLATLKNPTTVIYPGAKNIASNIISSDGTVAIRIANEEFCKTMISGFGHPVVSTSANISGQPFPKLFENISSEIKNGVDYIVQHRQKDLVPSHPSSIIRVNAEGKIEVIRV